MAEIGNCLRIVQVEIFDTTQRGVTASTWGEEGEGNYESFRLLLTTSKSKY